MNTEILQIVFSLATSLLVAIFTAVVTVTLSYRRFRNERRWEKKYEAYNTLFEAIYKLLVYDEKLLMEVEEGTNFSKEYKDELGKRSHEGWVETEKAAIIGGFIMSEDTQNLVWEMKHDLNAISNKGEMSWFEELEERVGCINQYLERIQNVAMKDLKIK